MIIINTDGKNLLRSDSAYNWNKYNPILAENELVIETDAVGISFKLGDGISTWKELLYCAGAKSCPYQIGDIYTTLSTVKPQDRWKGTTWEELPAGRVMIAQGTYIENSEEFDFTAGFIGGEAKHQITLDEMAEHTHTRGTMNITGKFGCDDRATNIQDGAFYSERQYKANTTSEGGDSAFYQFNFDASRSWIGETSKVGANKKHNNLQPYLSVYMYKRTA